jgi:hypothetical protein
MATSSCPSRGRLLGRIEAALGVLMLGWSTAILVAGMGASIGRLFDSASERGTTES